jgi:hypothetical protein
VRKARRILVVGLILVAVGCGGSQKDEVQRIVDSPIDIQSSYEPGTDFRQYKTWNWIPAPQGIPSQPQGSMDPAFDQEIKEAVEGQMFSRGYRRVDSAYDLIANYHFAVEPLDMKMIDQMYGGQLPDYVTHIEGTDDQNLKWDQGTLIVFLFDAKNGQLVWRAAAQAEVTNKSSESQRQGRINKAVTMMLAKLPMQSP